MLSSKVVFTTIFKQKVFSTTRAKSVFKRSFRSILQSTLTQNGARRAPNPLATARNSNFTIQSSFQRLINVHIQRVFMGKKTPFLYVIGFYTSRGIQGGKRPQSTPVRGLLKSQIYGHSQRLFPRLFWSNPGSKPAHFNGHFDDRRIPQ
jgi:hypothetical protein